MIATHSPILMTYPGVALLSFDWPESEFPQASRESTRDPSLEFSRLDGDRRQRTPQLLLHLAGSSTAASEPRLRVREPRTKRP